MRVEMLTQISGTRDGAEWPVAGGTIEVPDHEAADLITAGYAKEATDAPDPEPAAAAEPDEEGDEDAAVEEGDPAPEAEPVKPTRRPRKAAARKG